MGVVAEDLQEVFVAKRRGIWPGGSWSVTKTGLSGRWRCLPRVWLLSVLEGLFQAQPTGLVFR